VNRTTMTLTGAVIALAAMTGVAAVAAPGDDASGGAPAAGRKPVERSTLVCPQPTMSDVADTSYAAFTPKGSGGSGKGGARLYPAPRSDDGDGGGKDTGKGKGKGKKGGGQAGGADAEPVVPMKSPGTPVVSTTSSSDAPALYGSADGRFAPGWTVQQTTNVAAGAGRGLQGTSCSAPDTDFWFPGASTSKQRQDFVHLTNPDGTSAVADVDLYGAHGRENSGSGEGITIPPHSSVPVLLSTLTSKPSENVTVHVVTRTGRLGAQVQAVDKKSGGDWLPPASDPSPSAVMPGVPGDASSVRLVVYTPGQDDADLKVRLAGPNGQIAPAGYETLHARGGMTTAVDLHDLTKGDAGSLVLTPSDKNSATPVVAALRVTRGKGAEQETGFIPATAPIDKRGTVAENGAGRTSQLSLTATGKPATARVTSSAGSGGGTQAGKTVTIKGDSTKTLTPPKPEGGKGTYAVTVERLSGGPLYASRTLEKKTDGVPAFTIQTMPDDRGSVSVPGSGQDLSVLTQGQ
jgi:hypothetical protein